MSLDRQKESQIAIITRTKNRPVLLQRAITDVLDQTYSDWIHVIINDGGDREIVDYLVEFHNERYDGRSILIHNDVSRGMETASNIGIRACGSKYIVIHDDDDGWSPDYLRVMISNLEHCELPSVKGAVSLTNQITERIIGLSAIPESVEPYYPLKTRLVPLDSILRDNLFPPIAFIYEREYAESLNFYDESFPVLGDWDFNVRFLLNADITVVPRYLAYYHIRKSGNLQNTLTAQRDLHERYANLLRNRWIREGLTTPAGSVQSTDLSAVYKHIETLQHGIEALNQGIELLQQAQHNTALTVGNIQKQEDIIFQRIENIERHNRRVDNNGRKRIWDALVRRFRHGGTSDNS